MSGIANSFPFLYQGLEHEVSDPGQLSFESSGNVYNPQIQRELSLIGPQGIFGPPSGFGNGGFSSPSGQGNGHQTGQSLGQTFQDLNTVVSAASLASPAGWFGFSLGGSGSEGSGLFSGSLPIPFLSNLLCLIDCSNSNGDQPRRPPHDTSQTYLTSGIQLISQKSAAGDILQATRINPGDDRDLGLEGKALDAEIRRLSELARSMPSGGPRQKLQRKIDQLRTRKSKKAHSADKFSWIPIVPEAPLAADSSAGLPEAADTLIELIEVFGLL